MGLWGYLGRIGRRRHGLRRGLGECTQIRSLKVVVPHVEVHHRHGVYVFVAGVVVDGRKLILVTGAELQPLDTLVVVNVGEPHLAFAWLDLGHKDIFARSDIAQGERLGEGMKMHGDVVGRGVEIQAEEPGDVGGVHLAPGRHNPVGGELLA